jgi:transcriptional repressor NF-X1
MLRMRCHCGHEEKTIKCGTLHPQTAAEARINVDEFLSCGNTCGKLLPCGLHKCEKTCHKGNCGDCEIIREKKCYCGQGANTSTCGGASQASLRHECVAEDPEDTSWTGEFSCGRPCPWVYDCGVHTEAKLSSTACHPHSSSKPLPCPRTPAFVITCPCGKKPLTDLSAPSRQKCTDPIPTCGSVCNKIRSGCGHACTASCHEGPCEPCEEQFTLVCSCGNDKKTMKCRNVPTDEGVEFQCERICKALKACGRHECGRKVSLACFSLMSSLREFD